MKIVVTGSLGHISKPLSVELIKKGHQVIVVSSDPKKEQEIRLLGATPAIGSVEDVDFLTRILENSGALYCMTPPHFAEPDQIRYYQRIAQSYATAISRAAVKRAVYLSSYGAHLPGGTGYITGSHKAEKIFDSLHGVYVTHVRPTYFYYNLLNLVNMIKSAGFIASAFGGEDRLPMVAPSDIATVIAGEIAQKTGTNKIVYVTSDDRTCNEVAGVLGNAIGIPSLEWRVVPPEQVKNSLIVGGMPENAAATLVELQTATHAGILREDFDRHPPAFGVVKIEDYAKEFAAIYNKSN